MIINLIKGFVLFGAFVAQFSSAAGDAADFMKAADDFAACSGKYSALADFVEKEKYPAEVATNFRGNANGATLAAATMIQLSRGETKALSEYTPYIESIAHVHSERVKILLLDPTMQLQQIMTDEMTICIELNSLQAKIANEMRKEIHLNK